VNVLAALFCGVVFGAGLAIAEMTNPAKVQAFLDVAGDWDPSLAFVMGSALLVTAGAYVLAGRRSRPALAESFQIPTSTTVDRRLLVGATLFGAGWGLGGFCPGPALAALVTAQESVLLFTGWMLLGIFGARLLMNRPTAGAREEGAQEEVV
jgi:uncharacterized membrane protein YedE/YeeE